MPRATTKEELIRAAEDNFNKLFALIDSLSEEEREKNFAFEDRDRNVRDVLVHLYEWHKLLLSWIGSNRSGIKANFLPEPYNWKTYPDMNIVFWKNHQKTPLDRAIALVNESHKDVMALIESFSPEELFTKKYYPWTGTTSLGSYFVSAAPSHYEWATKKIKQHKKQPK